MSYHDIIVENKGPVCIIKLNRPKTLNAIIPNILTELSSVYNQLEKEQETRIVILTGEGRAFAAGADITSMKDMSPEEARIFVEDAAGLFRRMEKMHQIFIAAINGYALGGGLELALSCDFRLAEKNAKFGLPETGLGIIPGWCGTQRLPRLIGVSRAKEMILTGRQYQAEEALLIGLINKITEKETLLEEAFQFADNILKKSPLAVCYGKEAINRGIQVDMDSAMDIEKNLFSLCFATQDQTEGMAAFLEKRTPVFTGK